MEIPFAGEFAGHFEADMSIFFDFELASPVPVIILRRIFGGFPHPDKDQIIIDSGEVLSAGEGGFIFAVIESELFTSGKNNCGGNCGNGAEN